MAIAKSIIFSSIWTEPPEVLKVWLTLAIMADRDGQVALSIDELARAAHLSEDACRTALDMFRRPDPASRTKEHEGRRIIDVDGGWKLLDHAKDRGEQLLEQRRDAHARRQREYVERKRARGPAGREATRPVVLPTAESAVMTPDDAGDEAASSLERDDAVVEHRPADVGPALTDERDASLPDKSPTSDVDPPKEEESLADTLERLFAED